MYSNPHLMTTEPGAGTFCLNLRFLLMSVGRNLELISKSSIATDFVQAGQLMHVYFFDFKGGFGESGGVAVGAVAAEVCAWLILTDLRPLPKDRRRWNALFGADKATSSPAKQKSYT